MKTRKHIAILAATAAAGLGLTALATPASANTTVTIGGTWAQNDVAKRFDSTQQSTLTGVALQGTVAGTELTIGIDSGAKFGGKELGFYVVSDGLTNSDGDACSGGQNPCLLNFGTSSRFLIATTASNTNVAFMTAVGGKPYWIVNQEDGLFKVAYQETSAPAPAAPAVVDVTLDQITSEVLRTWASTATVGSWKELPESSEITGVDENAGKTFLGAATTPDFPVDIAQRQVDNGWGAYETFNEDGDLTSVFIPAGGWMAITNSTRLYAIWSE